MGYDDNTPLTGVTGGGLPAEIWHEVMLRVHEGLPPTPLQMIIPAPRVPPQAAAPSQAQVSAQDTDPAPQAAPEPALAPAPVPAKAEKPEGLLRNVLGALSGNN
jgi:penicillin-binding protein 1A